MSAFPQDFLIIPIVINPSLTTSWQHFVCITGFTYLYPPQLPQSTSSNQHSPLMILSLLHTKFFTARTRFKLQNGSKTTSLNHCILLLIPKVYTLLIFFKHMKEWITHCFIQPILRKPCENVVRGEMVGA